MVIITICILFTTFSPALAPAEKCLYLEQGQPINPYLPILRAVTTVESANGRFLFNEKENAVGWFGIRPVRLNDYNQKTGQNITLDQCYDFETGKTIFLWYVSQIDYRDIKAICRNWNGASKRNLYFQKVKAIL